MKRIASIDIFRAFTMLMMLFVNDFSGMSGIPHWMHHAGFREDMLGFSDLVFPAFLFCVGLSIPFAIGNRYQKGASQVSILGHILSRALALIIMGIFSMNLRSVEGGLSHPVLTLLAVAGYFLIWNNYPRREDGRKPVWTRILQGLGVAILVAMVIYKDLHGMPFRHGWWGILGLIGWAYLPCALAYLFLRGDFNKLTGFWLLTLVLCVLNSSRAIPLDYSSRNLILGFWPGGWTHPALCATGMFTAMLLIRLGEKPKKLFAIYGSMALAFGLLGLLCHRFWIISKNMATPTWAFYCLAIFVVLFCLVHWVADLKGWTAWSRPISPAGTATLTCYIIPSIWYETQDLLGLEWPAALTDGIPGLLKALAFGFVIIGITWLFERMHLKLKL